MPKNIEVVDEAGNTYAPTYPKRAAGLVKHGRARFIDENRICLACPPDTKMEDNNMNELFGEMTVQDILGRISSLVSQTDYLMAACNALAAMDDGETGKCAAAPENVLGKAKANALATVVQSRETTNQIILHMYEKVYDDLMLEHRHRYSTEQTEQQ